MELHDKGPYVSISCQAEDVKRLIKTIYRPRISSRDPDGDLEF